MTNITPELIAKAKVAKSAEELFELAKANNVEMTEEEAKTYFAQLSANATVADEELEAVAGGCGPNEGTCPQCGGKTTASYNGAWRCERCSKKGNSNGVLPSDNRRAL